MQSSRVGVSTIACVSSFSGSRYCEQRQAEGGGLAGPGLRLADHVVAGEQLRDRLLLDRRRLVVAELVERLQDPRASPRSLKAILVAGSLVLISEGSSSSLPVVRRACRSSWARARLATAGRRRRSRPRARRRRRRRAGRRSSARPARGAASRCTSQKPITDFERRSRWPVATSLLLARGDAEDDHPPERREGARARLEGLAAAHVEDRRRPARRRSPRGSPP